MKNKKVFAALWTVTGLFALGMLGVLTAAFTTHPTDFGGEAELHLAFENAEHKPILLSIQDEKANAVAPDADGAVTLRAKFESRETNIFDLWLGGPKPRTAVVSFLEDGTRRHELTFTFDRHDHVWQCEVAFPDPTISKVDVEKSTLVFKGPEGEKRVYSSVIFAKALIGPPIITGD